MPEDKRCGTCTHFHAFHNSGWCGCPLPFFIERYHVGNIVKADDGKHCPCWARKDDVDET